MLQETFFTNMLKDRVEISGDHRSDLNSQLEMAELDFLCSFKCQSGVGMNYISLSVALGYYLYGCEKCLQNTLSLQFALCKPYHILETH